MELNNEDHNTRLYVSQDAPHNGANISIGLQELIIYENSGEQYQLRNPAARHMLLNHGDKSFDGGYRIEHEIRTSYFKPLFNTIGFPQDTRNIAISIQ